MERAADALAGRRRADVDGDRERVAHHSDRGQAKDHAAVWLGNGDEVGLAHVHGRPEGLGGYGLGPGVQQVRWVTLGKQRLHGIAHGRSQAFGVIPLGAADKEGRDRAGGQHLGRRIDAVFRTRVRTSERHQGTA